MSKWEYLVIHHFEDASGWRWLPSNPGWHDIDDVLEHVGSIGWELVSCSPNYYWTNADDIKSPGVIYTLKRKEN